MPKAALAHSAIDHSDQAVINANPNTQERNTMTSGSINSFVGDLVEMAKAMETLPQVQQDLANAKDQEQILLERINSLAADLEQSRNYAASLEQKVRTTEAERDDAEIRFLELEDKSAKVVSFLAQIQGMAVQAEVALVLPKPEPISEPFHPPVPEVVQSIEPQPSGQGETDPTTAQALVENSSTSASSPDASDNGPMVVQGTPTQPDDGKVAQAGSVEPLPYAGLRYVDVRGYIPYHDWVAGGGNYASYWEGRST